MNRSTSARPRNIAPCCGAIVSMSSPRTRVGPGFEGARRRHVAAVETLHERDVRVEVRDVATGLSEGGAEIAGVEDLPHGIIEVKVSGRVEVVRRDDEQFDAAEHQLLTFVRDGLDPVEDQAIRAEVGDEAVPELRQERRRVGGQEPAVGRRDDVRVLVGEKDPLQLRTLERLREGPEHLGVELAPARIEHHRLVAVNDDVLIGRHALASVGFRHEDIPMISALEGHDLRHDDLQCGGRWLKS